MSSVHRITWSSQRESWNIRHHIGDLLFYFIFLQGALDLGYGFKCLSGNKSYIAFPIYILQLEELHLLAKLLASYATVCVH